MDQATATAPGCRLERRDTAGAGDPYPIWSDLACADASRYSYRRQGGDLRRTAVGRRQGNSAYRSLSVVDGDEFYGERCELGNNDRASTFFLYGAEERHLTFLSLRLARDFPLDVRRWQTVMQMKQVQPANNGGGTPVLALHAYGGRWRLMQSTSPLESLLTRQLWSAPASTGRWTRIALDVTYSNDAERGLVRAYVDTDGDGDFTDRNERSGAIRAYTLKTELPGTDADGLIEGAAIPSHLRVGIYHDEAIPCADAGVCRIGVDNVQVLRPRR